MVLLYFSSLCQCVRCFQFVAPENSVFTMTATVHNEAILCTPDDTRAPSVWVLNLLKPGIQALSLSLPEHDGKVGDELMHPLDLLISFPQLGQVFLLPVQTLLFFKSNPMGPLRSRRWTLGGSLDRRLGSRINLFEGPCLVEVFAQVPKESHDIAISARIALLFHFTIGLLSVPASFIPSLNQVGLVWLKHWLARLVNMGPFWRLLHTIILVDPTRDSHLPGER